MVLGNKQYSRSPVAQSFIWAADYYDGSSMLEFDPRTHQPNSFYAIDRSRLVRFGLIGGGSQIFFDVGNGVFELNGHRIMVTYAPHGREELPLTGRAYGYSDIITYKDAVADADLLRRGHQGRFAHEITAFSVGYKKLLELEGVRLHYQALVTVPEHAPVYMQLKLTSEQALEGRLNIRVNGKLVDSIEAPLQARTAGMINWHIKG
ncbi:hypothetical protein [Paenibacillus sp. SYP-B4298]|uniref:hypothetical protein n=1 Tax=Paenibacillus sp. SYP-B4298 TaxID=2996034 RepID=UPI0022DE2B1E|nr:hypothetical protein [Paenibacillus sp. SYP-B4298]